MRIDRLAALLGALLATAALGQSGPLVGRRLSEVRFTSDAPIDQNGLRTLLALAAGEPVTEEVLAESRRLLELTELFRRIDLRLEPDGDGERVALIVDVSRRPVIDDVLLSGLGALSGKEARRLIRLDKGTIYDPTLVDQAQERLIERYRRMAFVDAVVQVTAEPHDRDMTLHFDIQEGIPETIAAVVVEGDLAAWDAALQKRAKKIEGGRRTRDAVRNTERKLLRPLRAKGYYEARLHWTWEAISGNRGVLRLGVDSGPLFQIRFVGNRAKSDKRLLRLIDLEQRLIVTDGTWRELARRIRESYQGSGYYAATVAVEVGDGDPKPVTFRIEEGRKYAVRRVEFEGNERLTDGDLQAAMATAPWHWLPWPGRGRLVSSVLDEDMKRVRHLYRQRGFPSAVVHKTRREVDERRGEITIVVPIEEGPQTIVREVRAVAVPAAVNRAALAVRAGAPLDPEAVEADRRAIATALERDGHPAPRVEAAIDRAEERSGVVDATVTWKVDPGQRQRIGRLIVQHNVDTHAEAIVRELPFHEGDPLAVDRLLEGQIDVYRLGLFRSVSIAPITPEGEEVRDVAVDVTEQPAGTLGFGGGYNTRDGIEGFVEVGYDNVGGMARRISLRGEASLDPTGFTPDQYLANLGFIERRLLDSPWRYKVNLIGERATETVDKFSLERVAFVQALDRKLWKRVQVGMQLEVEKARVFDVKNDADLVPEDEGALRTVALSPFIAYDGRDDPFLPTRGVFDAISFRYALPALSDVQFAKFTTQHTQWVPLFDGVTWVYSARLGAGRTISGSPILPIRERFFLGGRSTVRGFAENSIGPTGKNGNETGGDLSVNLNTELIVPLVYGFQLAFFVDGGGLYLLQCDADCRSDPEHPVDHATLSLENFRRSAGMGLRFNTPVGPLALDYGIKLDRRDGESFGRLHFNVGTTF